MGGRDLVALGTVQAFLGDNGAVLVDERRHETDRGGADRLAVDRDGPAGRMGHNILGQDPVEQDGVGLRQDPPDRGFDARTHGPIAPGVKKILGDFDMGEGPESLEVFPKKIGPDRR